MQQVVNFVTVAFVVGLVLLLPLLIGTKKKRKKEVIMRVRMLTLVQKELLVLTSDFVSIPFHVDSSGFKQNMCVF